ncbi:glycosyltransferase family 4 protein [Dyadobacter sp. CY323]|uniref:glycosyltransferase family 4 protein n=1 Tax=Dyadobacter sp. CY323 TaxID=2907302 RepID=UPI001F29419C|nr:glycosyltransferase family 4 protein [Dyadobacter sp. CY323]MCE6992734.1 glycosyltransferase family 4 protein [Dyadobacter sp. CY323]
MVLHLSTFHLEGGAGVAATRLHRALLKSGIDSHLLVPTLQSDERNAGQLATSTWKSRKAFGRFVAERLYFLPHEKDKSIRFAFSPAVAGADISQHPLVKKADILHLHWVNFGFLSLSSLEKLFSLGKPIVWTMHDMWTVTGGCHYSRGCDHYLSHCNYCPYLAKPDRYDISFDQFEVKRKLYALAKMALISPSFWLKDLTKNAALTGHLNALTIPNCIDTNLFKPLDKINVRTELQLPTNKKLILFAGANTQDPRKGFLYFREAIEHLKMSYENIEVLIFGKADNQSFTSFPVPVHYLGKITHSEEIVKVYNAADMIVVPSLEDNLPNTIMEAMACGTPAVGFATGGIPEMIDHKHNGFVAELKSPTSLSEGIKWVLKENTEGILSENAREKVLNQYSEGVVASQYQTIYQSLMNG